MSTLTPEEEAEIAELPENHPALKALRATRSELREERAKAHLFEVQAKFPSLGLTPEDFEGLTPDKYEGRAQRLAALAADRPAPPPPPEPQKVEDVSNRDALANLGNPPEGVPPQAGTQIPLNEAFALYKRNPAEFERLKQAGLIKGWPQGEDHGGTTRFGG